MSREPWKSLHFQYSQRKEKKRLFFLIIIIFSHLSAASSDVLLDLTAAVSYLLSNFLFCIKPSSNGLLLVLFLSRNYLGHKKH